MSDLPLSAYNCPPAILAATRRAAHRRDHHHADAGGGCHPHYVEVIDLGTHAFALCHDCSFETGANTHHGAEVHAHEHRAETTV
jgi:hypothetical protein